MAIIAHIEDNKDDVLLLKRLLDKHHDIEHFFDLDGFLSSDQSFDLVVADLNLPGSYGYETIQSIKGNCPDLPIMVLTGIGGPYLTGDIIEGLLGAGADNVASKDILTDSHLLVLIENLLAPTSNYQPK